MDFDFSKRSEEAILHAHKEAIRAESAEITPGHLFLGIVKVNDQTRRALLNVGMDIEDMISTLTKNHNERGGHQADKTLRLSKSSEKIMKIAPLEAKLLKQELVEPHHMLLSILRDPSNLVYQEFEKQNLIENTRKEIEHQVSSGFLKAKKGFFTKWF